MKSPTQRERQIAAGVRCLLWFVAGLTTGLMLGWTMFGGED